MMPALDWQAVGTIAGSAIIAILGWIFRDKLLGKKDGTTNPDPILRKEFTEAVNMLQLKISEAANLSREAKASAEANQRSLQQMCVMIESSMRSLGDRLEGPLLRLTTRVESNSEILSVHHGRISVVESKVEDLRHP